MKILVTGATGMVGKAICRELANEGHQIVVLSRHPENARVVPGAEAFHWEPEAELPPGQAWDGVDAIVHLAGEPVVGSRWTNEKKRHIHDSRIKGTRHLVEAIGASPVRPKVLVSASAVGYYGDRGDEHLDERASPGRGFLSDLCQEWESTAAGAQAIGLRVAQVRIGVVLGEAGGALDKMLLPFKLGVGGRLGNGRQWFPWIHIDDITGIIKHLLFTPFLNGPINGVAPGNVTNEEFTHALASVLHRPAIFPVPEFALRILLGEMAEAIMSSQRVIPKLILDSGYRFRFPMLKPALQDLLKGSS